MKSIAVIGSEGFVGSALRKHWSIENVEAPSQSSLDISDFSKVDEWVASITSDCIMNLAAYTNVDQAEKEPEIVTKINTDAALNLARAAHKYNKFYIFISTDFIKPESEHDILREDSDISKFNKNEIGVYGQSKLVTELSLKQLDLKYAVVRITFPFGFVESEKDYCRKLLSSVQKGYALFADQILTMTYLPDMARVIQIISENKAEGVFHVACEGKTSPYEVAKYILSSLDIKVDLKKGSMDEFLRNNNVAKRPINGGLETYQTQEKLNVVFRPWQEEINKLTQSLKNYYNFSQSA